MTIGRLSALLATIAAFAVPLHAQSAVATTAQATARTAVLAVVDSALAAINRGDMLALSNTMTDDAQVYAARVREGTPMFAMRTVAAQRAQGQRPPIIERGFDPEVRIAGGIASVWLPYDLWAEGRWCNCGVDHFTLVQVERRWRIVNFTYSVEQPPACRMHPAGPPAGHQPPP